MILKDPIHVEWPLESFIWLSSVSNSIFLIALSLEILNVQN